MDVHVYNLSIGGKAGIGLGPRSLLVSQPSQNNEFLASERPCLGAMKQKIEEDPRHPAVFT